MAYLLSLIIYDALNITTIATFIYRSELTKFLHSLDIYFSRRKWQQIFRQMDKNQESPRLISLIEFSLFVFPDHSTALSEETQRLKAIKDEVR